MSTSPSSRPADNEGKHQHGRDPKDLVELVSLGSDLEAELLMARLRDEGIDAVSFSAASEGIGYFSASTSPHMGANVRVRREDLAKAQQVLADFEAEAESSADLDDDEDEN